jgi:hypothetical protein
MPQSPTASNAPLHKKYRRFISRADALTLLGMILLVGSLFFYWKELPIPPGMPVLFKMRLFQSGYALPDWKIMVACAVGCNLCLLWTPNAKNRYPLSLIHGVLGVAVLVLILRYISAQPGAIGGLVAGVCLAWGALERFQDTTKLLAQQEEGGAK